MKMYGLSPCPDCKRAIKTLAEAEIDVDFRDVRSDSMSEDEWAVLLGESGDNLVDRKSQAYRNLNAWMRETRQTLNWPIALPSWPSP
jgi:arsenate reductase-like glutaredoxin family protein